MLPRCGRVAHICEANWILQLCFPAAIAFLKLSNSNKVVSWESRLQIQTRQRGNCSTLVGKSRGGTPFCRTRKTVFPKSIVFRQTLHKLKSFSVQQFYKNAAEVWASSPHLRSKLDFATLFSCCNCMFWNCPIQIKLYHENQGYKFGQGNGAIAARW